jgi:hypothetical protein
MSQQPRSLVVIGAAFFLFVATASTQASHLLFSDTAGHTTLEQIVTGPDPNLGYANLTTQLVSGSHLVRDGVSESNPAIPNAQSGRDNRRTSLAYFGQLTDFQLADEETPAKVEFLDPGANSAWRPQEAFQAFIIDSSIRQMNLFAGASPVAQGDDSHAAMDFALVTGDQADSAQRNETIWTRELIEGGTPLDFNSGVTDTANPSAYNPTDHPSCAPYAVPPPLGGFENPPSEAPLYTGVQDYTDYDEGNVFVPQYYDPADVRGSWATNHFPTYTGLMDRAQTLSLTPAGLAVPSYVTNGNHDPLVQGNEDPIEPFENIATGCLKMLASTAAPAFPGVPDPSVLLAPPAASTLVPPDPLRRYVSKPQIKAIYGGNGQDNAHGFDYVSSTEETASNDSASYYAWDPPQSPQFRFISIDTVSEGGQTAEGVGCGSANGNIDNPQWQWLVGELDAATARDKLIVLFGHHPIRSLCTQIPDENAQPCTTQHNHGDTPEHDRNPGCDLDPRVSEPLHLGEPSQRPPGNTTQTLSELLNGYPHLIAYVSGHTHDNNISAFPRPGGGVWWGIETSATADWPVQHRLIEVMDNHDGTLSIFGTLLDAAAAAAAPPLVPETGAQCLNATDDDGDGRVNDGCPAVGASETTTQCLNATDNDLDLRVNDGCPPASSAAGYDSAQLASIGRELAYNDPQAGDGTGEGALNDQNVELLVRDPRLRGFARPKSATPLNIRLVPAFEECISDNASHGAPLSVPSCSPPQLASDYLTVGTPDANGKPAASMGVLTLKEQGESPINPGNGDQADVEITASFTDVRNQGTLTDYTGELGFVVTLRITDRFNGTTGGPNQLEPATTVDVPLPFSVPCSATGGSEGATCNVTTGADAVTAGNVANEGKRAVWDLREVKVYDGGGDGDADTTGDNTVFAVQGLYAP